MAATYTFPTSPILVHGPGYNAHMKPQLAWWIVLAVGCGGPGPASQAPPPMDAPRPEALFTYEADAAPSTGGGLSRGVAWGDIDTDGDPDLVVANAIGQAQMLYRNDGPAGFNRLQDDPVTLSAGDTEGAFWADADNDGDLDLLLTNQFDQPLRFFRNDGQSSLILATAGDLGDDRKASANSACWGDFDNDGHLDVFVVQRDGLDDLLFSNLGDGRFHRIAEGDAVTNGGDGRTCACGDIDADGDLDLFVGNFVLDGAKAPNFLYRNRGDGTFETVTEGEIITDLQATYGSSFVDIDDDGDADLFLSNIAGSDHNALYLNDGLGHFSKRTDGELVTAASRPSKGHAFGDYDLDGDLDLVIANGTESEVDLRNFLYLNDGAGRFVAVTEGDLVDTPNISAGVAWADADLDGDLDLFIANWGGDNEANAFYRNHATGRSWLVIRLIGTKSNRMGWGARVRITAVIDGSTRTQTRWMNPTTGYASQNEPILHFGLGDASHIDSIEITWPSGTVDHLGPVDANRILGVTEGRGRV